MFVYKHTETKEYVNSGIFFIQSKSDPFSYSKKDSQLCYTNKGGTFIALEKDLRCFMQKNIFYIRIQKVFLFLRAKEAGIFDPNSLP